MARQFYMCNDCKCDKAGVCDYECIKQRSDFMFRFFTCPRFIYDDGTKITNAERVAMDLKENTDSAATELWYKLAMDDGLLDFEEFQKWLKEEAKFD